MWEVLFSAKENNRNNYCINGEANEIPTPEFPKHVLNKVYAILDIETTGGKYNEEGITEIAIYRFDGDRIVDQFSSLINPERPIQPFVVNLTGINSEMLRRAPKFYEVAKRIIEITSDCILVAHNALFDSRILATEFDRLGYKYEREAICTVELSKKLFPDMPSYSLGKLVKQLGIPMSNRHRAQGDAIATVSLFKILLAKDDAKEIIAQSIRQRKQRTLQPDHLALIDNAPTDQGVYYMYNEVKRLVFIGKGKNIRKKLTQHFTYENNQSKRLQKEVTSVAFEKTGNELISAIKENEEVLKNKPLYNRKNFYRFTHQINSFLDEAGFIRLRLEKLDGRKRSLAFFTNAQQGAVVMEEWHKKIKENPDYYVLKNKPGKIDSETVETHNRLMKELIAEKSLYGKDCLLIGKGRNPEERSLIRVENGRVKGYGFYNLNHQIVNPEILENLIVPVSDIKTATQLAQYYFQRDFFIKTISLPSSKRSV